MTAFELRTISDKEAGYGLTSPVDPGPAKSNREGSGP
jgi:hypothetical protein